MSTSTNNVARLSMTAIIKSKPSKVLPKSNKGQYVLLDCLITSGKATGMLVTGTRTVLTKDAEVKEIPEIGTEITLYHTVLPSTKEGEKNVHFFEISLRGDTASNAELDDIFGY